MAQRIASDNIEAHIQGEISGQVAVGKHILQVHAEHGAIVNVSQENTPQPRPTPVLSLRPRRFSNLRDRQPETEAAVSALLADQPVELYGKAGVGKTTLLRHLAYHSDLGCFSDGIIYRSALHQPLADLFQFLFDAFYESDFHFKPTDTQVRHFLQGKRALVLLDDVKLSREEVEELILAVPSCAFVIASLERCLWPEIRSIALRGLPRDEAVALVEQEFGRPLAPQEREAAQMLCATLDGHPLRILQEAVAARDESRPLLAAADLAQANLDPGEMTVQTLASLPASQQSLLGTLAGLGGAAVHAKHLTALTGSSPAELEALEQRKLAKVETSRYSLTGNLADVLERAWHLTKSRERALAYFIAWAEQHRQSPDLLLEEADAIQQLLNWAGATGRWQEAQRLGRAIEGALTLSGRWEAWKRVLQWVLQASQALKDRAGEAWAMHQLGSRALGLADTNTAATYLNQALSLRESLGDRVGAAVTRHNINVMLGLLPPPQDHPPSQSSTGSSKGASVASSSKIIPLALKIAIIPMVLIVGGLISWYVVSRTPKPDPHKPVSPVIGLSLSSNSLIFANQEVGTRSEARTVSVTNQSSQPLAFSINVTGNQASDFHLNDSCKNLPAGGSCNISVVFAPQAVGDRSANLTITPNNGDKPLSVSLSGAAVTTPLPVIRLSAGSMQFEDQPPGSRSDPKTITLTNAGQTPLNITDITVTGANAGDFIKTTRCGQTIGANESCTVSIVFAPRTAGSFSASLSINDNAAGSPQQVTLTGTSTAQAISFSLNPSKLDFGDQKVNASGRAQFITITNSSPVPIRIGDVSVSGEAPNDFKIRNACSNATIAPGGACAIYVLFVPASAGTRSASLKVTANAADNSQRPPSQQTATLSGSGVGQKAFDFTVSPPNFDLSNCKSSARCVRDFTITNTGSMGMNIAQITLSGIQENEYKMNTNCYGRNIPPGGTCGLTVFFIVKEPGNRKIEIEVRGRAVERLR